MMGRIRVDGKVLAVEEGSNLLSACLKNGVYIPSLCHLDGISPVSACCRLCFVEVEGRLVTACTTTVKEGMDVLTSTPVVRDLQVTGFKLILSSHRIDCKNCGANKRCELHKIARFLGAGLNAGAFARVKRDFGPVLIMDVMRHFPCKCVLCGRCVKICRSLNRSSFISFAKRGIETCLSFFGADPCRECLRCVDVCPTGALERIQG